MEGGLLSVGPLVSSWLMHWVPQSGGYQPPMVLQQDLGTDVFCQSGEALKRDEENTVPGAERHMLV